MLQWRRLLIESSFLIPFVFIFACFNQDPKSLFNEGYKSWQEGDYEKALRKFEKSIQLDPKSPFVPDALYMIGTIYYLNVDNYFKAIQAYNKLRADYPEDKNIPNVDENMGKMYMDLKEYDKSIPFFEELLARYPFYDKRDRARLFLAEAYLKSERVNEAKGLYRELLTSVYKWQALFALAGIYQSERNCEEAVKFFEQISKDSPYYLDAKLSEADCLEEMGQIDRAITVLTDLIPDATEYKPIIELRIKRLKQRLSEMSSDVKVEG
ncbi:MAG: tetratricopeptide repeat protein [Candidatus Dadabacteria bacterium]|nr:tetratricopeptide repeat protein [Candidatus Dadabacteria bacterium]